MTVEEYNKSVDEFSDRLFRFLVKNLRNEDLANDLVQDSFEKLWHHREDVEWSKSRSWLFTTGYRIMIDHVRKHKKQGEYDEQKAELEHFTNKQYTGLSEVLEDALNRLPVIQKQVVMLRDYEGYDYKEIGEITDLKEAQVKVYIFRARKKLKAYIGSIDAVI
jgi:RNA polymerase sigma-70 factor (ECF subfamily)